MDEPTKFSSSDESEIKIFGFFEALSRLAAFKADALLPSGKSDPVLTMRIQELEKYRDAFLNQVSKRRPDVHIIEQNKDISEPIVLTISYGSGIEFFEGLSLSLNRGGLFVKTEILLPIDSILDLTVVIEDINLSIKLYAKVIWTNPRETSSRPIGIGIKFPKLNPDQRALLEEFMQGFAPTATLIDLSS